MNTQTVTLDVTKRRQVMPEIRIGQGDKDGTTLVANIYDNGEPFTLTNYTVRFAMRLPFDMAYYSVVGTVSGNTATFQIDESYAASVAGVTEVAYVEVLSGSTVICSTNRIRVVCLESAYENVDPAHLWDNGVEQFLEDAQDTLDATVAQAQSDVSDAVDDADAATTRATQAAEAAEGVILDAVPTMSPTLKGGAKLGSGLEVDSDTLSIDLTDEATGTSVTAADASYLASLTVDGKAVQDGTPTPSAPVPIQVVGPNSDSEFGIKINNTLYPIDLQGNVLASLPDGTKDVLTVDSVGHVVMEKRTHVWNMKDYATNAGWIKSSSAINGYYLNCTYLVPKAATGSMGKMGKLACNMATPRDYVGDYFIMPNSCIVDSNFNFNLDAAVVGSTLEDFKTWLASNDLYMLSKLATPQTIDLGYIDMPAIPDGAEISITAQVTPTITASWWARGAAAIAEALKSLRDGLLARIDAIETAIADL